MLQLVSLFLPALFPSWRFFQEVAPSPRIEYRRAGQFDWTEAMPRQKHIGIGARLWSLFWNPDWNETLFLVSCAERLAVEPTAHAQNEIADRLSRRLGISGPVSYRIALVAREGDQIGTFVEYEFDVNSDEL